MCFFLFFLLCYVVIVKHTHSNILTRIDLQYSEICIIGLLVVLLHVRFSECWFCKRKVKCYALINKLQIKSIHFLNVHL